MTVPVGRWGRSTFFLGRVWRLLRGDRSLITVALVGSTLDALAAALVFGGIAWLIGHDPQTVAGKSWLTGLVSVALAFPVTVFATYCNVALLWLAQARFEGRRHGARQGFAAANGRLRAILAWSLLATGVGAVLDKATQWLPLGGALATWALGVAWSLATMFALPVVAIEDAGARAAARRSAAIFRARWGEGVIGQVAVSSVTMLLWIPGVAVVIAGVVVGGWSGIAIAAAGGVFLGVANGFSRALTQLYALAVYRHQVLGLGAFDLAPGQLDELVDLKPRKGR